MQRIIDLNVRLALIGHGKNGRGDWIRTSDILLPKQALYQAELHPAT